MIDMAKITAIRKMAQGIAVVSILLFVVLICSSGYQLHVINLKADEAQQRLTKMQEEEEKQNTIIKTKEEVIKERQAKIDDLDQKYRTMNEIVSKVGNTNPALVKQAVDQSIDSSPTAANLLPRIYVHIIDETQRDRAKQIASQLQKRGYLVPGIENVSKKVSALPNTQLRYFSKSDQEVKDVNDIAGFLQGANVKVSRQYIGKSGSIRPRHYEIWFGLDF